MRKVVVAVTSLAIVACGGKTGGSEQLADTMNQHSTDTVVMMLRPAIEVNSTEDGLSDSLITEDGLAIEEDNKHLNLSGYINGMGFVKVKVTNNNDKLSGTADGDSTAISVNGTWQNNALFLRGSKGGESLIIQCDQNGIEFSGNAVYKDVDGIERVSTVRLLREF